MKTKRVDYKLISCSAFCALIYGMAISLGVQLEKYGTINIFSFSFTIRFLTHFFLFCGLMLFLFTLIEKVNKGEKKPYCIKSHYAFFFICFGLFMLLWFFSFLGLYPGLFNFDSPGQWYMFANNQISKHHPVLHTILLGSFVDLGYKIWDSINKGIALYTLFQMVIMALCFAYVMQYLYRRKVCRLVLFFALLWFSLFPTIVLQTLSVTKDSLFSAFICLFAVLTLELFENFDSMQMKIRISILWIFSCLMVCILRNNAVYAVFPFLIILLFALKKKKKLLLMMYCILFTLYLVYSGPICGALTVQGVNAKEYLSVPTQQIVRTYIEKKSELDSEEIETIEEMFDEIALTYYNPKISDVVKGHFNLDDFENNKGKYVKFWIKLAKKFPKTYWESFLLNTDGFWYPYAEFVLNADGTTGYWPVDCYPPATLNSKIPFICNYYKLFQNSSIVQGNQWISWIFAPATYFYLALITAAYAWYKKDKKVLVTYSFIFLLWLTYLLGPVALVRYTTYLYFLVPVELGILFSGSKSGSNTEKELKKTTENETDNDLKESILKGDRV